VSTRYITGAIGAVVGYWIGGAQGAYYGWTIGSTVGGIADPGVIRGPSLNDVGTQTSQEGGPRPIVFALSPPMAGNVIASGPVRKIKKRKRQGKGGPKIETEALLRTYAIGVCEGPITRFVRVWKNAELVYDARTADEWNYEGLTDEEKIKYAIRLLGNNTFFVERARFYNGTYDQNADPALEEIFGVGTTPAHRGTAYMVVVDDDLTDYRGAIPQYMFQVERCEGYFLTSRPYPAEAEDGLDLNLEVSGGLKWTPPDEALGMGFAVTGGALEADVVVYEDAEPEALELGFAVTAGTLDETLIEYENAEPEALDLGFSVTEGTLDDALIEYENAEPEGLDLGFSVTGGSLT
jgi:hypothetical protein